KGPCIVLPVFAIEIDCKKKAGFIKQHGIDSHDEIMPAWIATGEMTTNHLICYRKPATVRTIAALDSWFVAQATHPFVGASRLVTGSSGFAAFKTTRIDILAPPKQRSEYPDFVFGRGCLRHESRRSCGSKVFAFPREFRWLFLDGHDPERA
ncbi:MAG TPA: hypothetical protein P5055_02210, partial [Candidatus Paceibacterota bacterium]|nr:hypothetical protein [Candidatus Paceibacterota bacterium]